MRSQRRRPVELALGRTLPQFRSLWPTGSYSGSPRKRLVCLVTALRMCCQALSNFHGIGEFATTRRSYDESDPYVAHDAALNDRDTGYGEQKMQIAAIVGGASDGGRWHANWWQIPLGAV